MSSQSLNLETLPSNHGYILNGRKKYGKQKVNNASYVKLIEPVDKNINVWKKSGYIKSQMKKEEEVEDGWTTISSKKRVILEKKIMKPCEYELKCSGVCPIRFDKEHRENVYHFSFIQKNEVLYKNGKPICKYKLKGCWEKCNYEHRMVFNHK